MAFPESFIQRAFAAGELSPALAARADLARYTMGLRTCRNFTVQKHGGAANRAGTRFIGALKTTSSNVTLIPYISETEGESVLIEHGNGYMRFWQSGAQVEIDPGSVLAYNGATAYIPGDVVSSGGVYYYCIADTTGNAPPNATYWYAFPGLIYEIPSPFTVAIGPNALKWVQSGKVITLTSRFYQPHDLVFQSLTRWVLIPLDTDPGVPAPVGLALAPIAGGLNFQYVVTAARPGSYEESLISNIAADAAIAAPTDVAPHALTWTIVTVDGVNAPEYYVYCDPYNNGTFGFIGTATGAAAFNNPGITPDFSRTPPQSRILFTAPEQYPDVCAYHKQRRFLAHTTEVPDGVYASRIGFLNNFGVSSPLQDDDAVTFRIAGNNDHAVRWMVALKDLLLMTDGGEWRFYAPDGRITPSSIAVDQETYVGISQTVRPVPIGNSVVYVQARNTIVRDLRFDQDVEGLAGRDLTVFSDHLFGKAGKAIRSMAYAQVPESIVWICRVDGTLLGLTYIREQEVYGWHRHDTTNGAFEQVAVIPGEEQDEVYLIVARSIGGSTVRYLERLESREIQNLATDGFFVDCGLSYSGAAVGSVGGLSHLEGQTVAAVGDGQYLGTFVVSGGGISFGQLYSNIHVGLPITADLETVDLDVAGSDVRGRKKRVQSVQLVIDASSRAFQVGESLSQLTTYRAPTYDGTDAEFTGLVEMNILSRFGDAGRIIVRQTAPLPVTILGVIPSIEVGGP